MPKGTNRIGGRVLCPYYRKDDRTAIWCEGLVEGSTICLRFRNLKDFWQHANGWCCWRYEACELWAAIHAARGEEE